MKTKIKYILLSGPTLFLMSAELQAAGTKKIPAFDWMLENMVFILAIFVILGAFLALFNSFMSLQADLRRAHGIVDKPKVATERKSIFQKLNDKAWSLVPMDKEGDIDLGHDYDGIRELDNRLPPWWVYMFYFTIAWAGLYVYVFHLSDLGLNQQEEYEVAMEQAEQDRRIYLATQANSIDESSVVFTDDAAALEKGKEVFIGKCAACHANDGGGGVGPNLTDDYWIHGGSMSDIFKTIKYGVPEKGMISWQSQINPTTMQSISSYIKTLHNTQPANPKAPQGDLFVENEMEAEADIQ